MPTPGRHFAVTCAYQNRQIEKEAAMVDSQEEYVLLSDTLPVRALVTVAALRRRGIEVRSVDRAAWGTRDASLFLVAFDVIGRERLRVLRQRFPTTPILSYSDDPRDEGAATDCGATCHLSTDVDALAASIRSYRAPSRDLGVPGMRRVQRTFECSAERGHLTTRY